MIDVECRVLPRWRERRFEAQVDRDDGDHPEIGVTPLPVAE